MLTLRHPSRRLVFLVLVAPTWLLLGRPPSGQADESAAAADQIKARLETAEEAYRTKMTSLKKDVLDSLDKPRASSASMLTLRASLLRVPWRYR
jgi:hypothetical protein